MQSSSKQIKTGAIVSYIALAVNILASLVYLPWMVNTIGKSNYALYTLATSFIAMLMVDFGLSASVSRFVAKYNAEGQYGKIDDVVTAISRLYILIDTVILAILISLFFCLEHIYNGLTSEEIRILKQLYAIVAIYSVVSFPFLPLSGILNAFELFIQQKTIELFNKILTIVLVVVSLMAGGDVKTLVTMNALSGVITILLKIYYVRSKTTVRIHRRPVDRSLVLDVAKFSVWVTVISIAQRCVFNLAPSILGIVSNSNEIALFAPANALESYFYQVSAAVNGLFLATVSRYIANDEREKIYGLMVRVGRYQYIVMGFVFIEFFCIGRDFMTVWMGKEFVGVWPCALMLFLPDVLIFSQQIANTAIIAENKVKEQAIGYVVMAITCICLSLPFSRMLGALGTCIAISCSYVVLFIYMNYLYRYRLGIDVLGFYKECYLALSIPMIVISTISFFICETIVPYGGWFGLALKCGIVFLLYALIMVFFLTKDERRLVMRLISFGKLKSI